MKNHYLCNCGQENEIVLERNIQEECFIDDVKLTCNFCNNETVAIIKYQLWGTLIDITVIDSFLIDINNQAEYIVEKAYLVSLSSLCELENMLKHAPIDGGNSLNRLFFTQLISTMEAYFYNTIKALVLNNKDIFLNFIKSSKSLSNEKYTIYEYLNTPMLPRERVIKRLNEILYHNLSIVLEVLNNTCNIEIKLNKDDLKTLNEAVRFRHDCTHRNGFNHKGEKLDVFTHLYITRILLIIKDVISSIHKKAIDIELDNNSLRNLLDNYLGYFDDEFTDEAYPYFKHSLE